MFNRRMPAEWEPQQAVMLTWPHEHSDWEDQLTKVEPVFHQLAVTIAQHQPVWIVAGTEALYTRLCAKYEGNDHHAYPIHVFRVDSNDTWARDHGPVSVYCHSANNTHEQLALCDFQFNGWGGKYSANHDNRINQSLAEQHVFNAPLLDERDWVLEGGSLETDGAGTLLTTEQCLLNPNRNPNKSRQEIEHHLEQTLGIQQVFWLTHGHLSGDDTDAHIDTLARFCNATTIAYCAPPNDPDDEHFAPLTHMQHELNALRTPLGQPYELIALPLPAALFNADGERLPATYANFLIINGAVLAPIYGVPEDQRALEQLQSAFPNHRIHAIDCRPIIEQFGSLHCLTMQIHANTPSHTPHQEHTC